jgi:dihydrodipicolinate synthase/N-acetylneuraminate lyase
MMEPMMFLLRMLMKKGRGGAMDPLHVSMTGVRMGEKFLQIGCYDKSLLAGLAAKAGLSGTSAVAAFDAADAERARKIGAKVGALIEIYDIDGGRAWPIAGDQFDMIVVDDTTGGFASLNETARQACLRNALGAVRTGGRIEVIARPKSEAAGYDPLNELSAAGFKPVRLLAEKDRHRFFEGLRTS